eukprot:c19141_g1_i1.p1 GENE.c19141_g1_i1~~c19141_g1_i1.p1  ORF type:complete len:900 (+),score=261.42 c19141_g1_i1:37-2700(+)
MSDFVGAGQKPGLEIWRIENFVAKPWKDVGKFCTGDSYIVLHSFIAPGKRALQYDVHFWLGAETAQDEAGAAALKTVELDDSLGGAPIQHREVQGHESDLFLSYFKKTGIEYIAGGVESGFTKVVRDSYEPRLLHVKGKRAVRVTPVPVAAASLNGGDVFILDLGLTIYQWNGKNSNRSERAKALDVTTSIKNDERGGRARLDVFDQGSETDEFWAALGGKIDVPEDGQPDDAFETSTAAETQLFRVSDASGVVEIVPVAQGKLDKGLLDPTDAFIVSSGDQVFVWVGQKATKEERGQSMIHASAFCQGNPRAQVTRIVQNAETPVFKNLFSNWTDMRPPTNFAPQPKRQVREEKEIDVATLLSTSVNPADECVDDGTGKVQIWRVEKMDKAPVPEAQYGHLYSGDSYIILYTYLHYGKEKHIIYYWQGRNSSQDEKAASAMLAQHLDDSMGGSPTQVRVVQGKEPTHFLSLFKGRLIIHQGGIASGFKNRNDSDSYDTDGTSLFHVKGTNKLNTRAVQVDEVAASLNSGDAFVLITPSVYFLWFGQGCNEVEQASARVIAGMLKHSSLSIVEIEEGSEPEEFWAALGGQGEYASGKGLVEAPEAPRLFHCSNAIGVFKVEEVPNFSQDDLDQSDVFILDVWSEIYVWLGHGANESEKQKAAETALKFVGATGRSDDLPVLFVVAGSEPPMFTAAFLGWDYTVAEAFEDPYEKKLRLIREAKAKEREAEEAAKPKHEEPKHEEPKHVEHKHEEPKPKHEEPKHEAPKKQEEPKKETKPEPVRATSGGAAKTVTAAKSNPISAKPALVQPVSVTSAAASSSAVTIPIGSKYFPYDDLKNKKVEGIDPEQRELYLADDEFKKLFKMDKATYQQQKGWKQQELKKKLGLF